MTDRELLDALRDRPFAPRELEALAKEYEVFRYPLNVTEGRKTRLDAISEVFDRSYRYCGTDAASLAAAWWDAVEKVHGLVGARLASFSMKALWFYHPQHATMCDSYTATGLNEWMRGEHPARIATRQQALRFLEDFERLFVRERLKIESVGRRAHERGAMLYPYPRRILDKALWLIGADPAERAAKIRSLADRAPWSRMMEEQFPILQGHGSWLAPSPDHR